jgi:serine protease AprX
MGREATGSDSAPSGRAGSVDERQPLRRRTLLRAAGAGALAAGLAGCSGLDESRRYEAVPVRLEPAAAERGYALTDASTVENTRTEEVGDSTLEVTLVNQGARYDRSGTEFVQTPVVGLVATPAVEEAGVTLNPVAERPLTELLTGNLGAGFVQQLDIGTTWQRGPELVTTSEGTLLGTGSESRTFAGVTGEGEFVLLNVTRVEDGDDAVLVGDARTKDAGEGERPFVGENGYVTQGMVDESLGMFLDLLGLVGREEPGTPVDDGTPTDGEPRLAGREAPDPTDVVRGAVMDGAGVVSRETTEIPVSAFSEHDMDVDEEEIPGEDPETIHPVLQEWLETRPADDVEELLVTFRDNVDIPRFPEPATDEPRTSATNRQVRSRTAELIEGIRSQRAGEYDRLAEELADFGAEEVERFWLVKTLAVEMPLGGVRPVADREDVRYVEPDDAGEEPPSDAGRDRTDLEALQDEVDRARGRMDTDPYYALGLDGGWIGLLDTGVRKSHDVFSSPSNLAYWRDCINGTKANCSEPTSKQDPDDSYWNHGTSTAAIISGNDTLGGEFRGVTDVSLDSFKVYPDGTLSGKATLRAFEAGLTVFDRVLVAEMQSGGSPTGAISAAADNAYDAGAVVIAANGNKGPGSGSVRAPANGHRSIGIGGFDVDSGSQYNGQSRGPTSDDRVKPDVQAPTNSETASAAADTATRDFGGTSGATPYGAGAAALLRNWLRDGFSIDPGQVYAQLVLSGQEAYSFDNTSGAGPLQLPTDGHAWWGKVSLNHAQQVEVPITVGNSGSTFDGALWWPEAPNDDHSVVTLGLVDPSGTTRDRSLSLPGVFQRARATGSVASGTWKLRLQHYHLGQSDAQTVYFAAHKS